MRFLLATWLLAAGLSSLYIAVGILDTILVDRRRRREDTVRQLLTAVVLDDRATTTAGGEAADDIPHRLLRRNPEVLRDMALAVGGDAGNRIRALAEAAGLARRVRRACRYPSWRARSRAAQLLSLLPDDDPVVARLLTDRAADVRARALDSLGADGVAAHGPLVLRACDAADTATRFAAQQALLRADDRVVPDLVTAIDRAASGELSTEGVAAVLGAAAGLPAPAVAQAVARHDWADDARGTEEIVGVGTTRRLVVDVLASGLAPDSERLLASFLDDPEPTVRAAALRALGRLGDPSLAGAIGRCLTDSNWQVRRAAGQALIVLGPTGRVVLRCSTRSPDRFARDMAAQMLERQALAPVGTAREMAA